MQPGSELVHVAAANHPLRAAVADYHVEAGSTVAELLEVVQPDPILRRHAHIFVDDWLIPRDRWHLVRPRAGRLVSIRVLPTGGGGGEKNPLRTLLTIAVLGASLAFGPALGAALVGPSGLTIGGLTLSASQVGSALILGAGRLLTNLIAPVRPPSVNSQRTAGNQAESPSYFLDQARNVARPYAPVPVIFGKQRVVPPLGAAPVTEVVGGDQYLRMIVVWGHGPCRISDIRIGQTPIDEFADVRIETREGRDNDDDITLYPDDIDQQNLTITLDSTAGWVTRRSAADADELSVDISLPRGLAAFTEEGGRTTNTVTLAVQYREVGEATWLSALDEDARTALTFDAAWITNADEGQVRLSGARTQPIRHGIRWSVSTRAQYDVRVQRISADETSDTAFSDLVWSALRTITDRPPIDYPVPLAISAIDIRATGQLSRVLDELNAVVEAEAEDWDGSSWSPAYTRNPASAFRLALQSPARAHPAEDDAIDLDALEDFHEFCDDHGYKFDFTHDTRRGLWDVLKDICAVARASPDYVDGKWTVIVDTGEQQVSQHFTPINASGFEMRRVFEPVPHGLRLNFKNEDQNYLLDELIVYADGYDESNAENLSSLDPVGIVNVDHLWKWGRFQLAQTKLRREVWSFTAGDEYLVVRRGSRLTFQHDVLAVGLAAARVASTELNSSDEIARIVLDVPIHLPEEIEYSVKVRTVADAHLLASITNTGGEDTDPQDTLVLAAPLNTSIEIETGALVSVGETGRVTIDGLCIGLEPAEDFTSRVLAVPYQEGVYDAETGTIPAFDSKISDLAGRLILTVVETVSDSSVVRLIADVYEPGIRIEVVPVQDLDVGIEAEIRPSGTAEPYRPAEVRHRARDAVEIGDVETGREYDVRLRWGGGLRAPGPWTEISRHEVTGNAVPPAPTNFLIDILGDGTRRFRWTPPALRSISGFELRYSDDTTAEFDDMTALHRGLLTSDHHETVEPQRSGNYRFAARSVDTEGLASDPIYIIAEIGPTRAGDVLYWRCPSAEGWPGTVVNAERTTDGLDALVGLPDYDWTDIATWADWDSWAGGTGDDYQTEMSYTAPVVDLGQVIDITIAWQGDTEGTVEVEYRASTTASDPSGAWQDVEEGQVFSARKVEVRWTLTGDGTSLLFLDHLCFSLNAPSATEYVRDADTSNWEGSASAGREIPSGLDLVTDISLTLQNVGAGYSWEIISKNPTPTIKIYDNNGNATDATVDAVIRGIRS